MIRRDTIKFMGALALGGAFVGRSGRASAQLFRKRAASGVKPGIDRLRADGFAALRGKRVGLITNQSGVDAAGVKTRLILHRAPEVNLTALYTPEHGLDGTEVAGKWVASRRDAATGLTAYSLYGKSRKPSAAMLKGIDVMVFDIQDVGTRMYTYVSTMGLCMEAAAQNGVEFMVLDRPNPLGGNRVEGPPIERRWMSFVGQYPVPFVHGLTAGELARMIVAEGWIAAKPRLRVVPVSNWKRSMDWSATGLDWVRTSPNIPRGESCAFYIATGIAQHVPGIEAGTGTRTPFEYVTAQGVDGGAMSKQLNAAGLEGVRFAAHRSAKRKGYGGVSLSLRPSKVPDLAALDVSILSAFYQASKRAGIDLFASATAAQRNLLFKIYGSDSLRADIQAGKSGAEIAASWAAPNRSFSARRRPHLLYA